MPAGGESFLRIQSSLTPRDRQLLTWLDTHGVLTTDQIAEALFPSLIAAQRRLLRLTARGVIDRFRPQRWDGGSYPYHYVLARLGLDVVCGWHNRPLPSPSLARRRRARLTSTASLPHRLASNGFFTSLAGYARTHPQRHAALERWWPANRFHEGIYRTGDNQLAVWDARPHPRPDGHGVWTEDGHTVPFFVEIDLGTEPLVVLIRKAANYDRRARAADWAWPVLVWLPSPLRERHLHEVLARATGPLRVPIATATTPTNGPSGETPGAAATGGSPGPAVWEGPAGPVWWLAGGSPDQRLRLAELPYTDETPWRPPCDDTDNPASMD